MRPGQAVCRPLVLLAIAMSLLLSGCGNTSPSELATAKAAGASEEAAKQKDAAQQQAQKKLAAEVEKLKEAAAKAKKQVADPNSSANKAAPPPAPKGSSCGGNLSVGPNTSCAFAANVEAAFYSAGGGTSTVEVYSPVTGKYYTMSCVAGVPSACRGGNNAVVYIR